MWVTNLYGIFKFQIQEKKKKKKEGRRRLMIFGNICLTMQGPIWQTGANCRDRENTRTLWHE